jgi:hypothetical protein
MPEHRWGPGRSARSSWPTSSSSPGQCSRAHLIENHPLKDGNAPVALIATIELCQRNGHPWWPPPGDEDGAVTATRFLELAAAPLTDDAIRDLATLVGRRMGQDDRGPRT